MNKSSEVSPVEDKRIVSEGEESLLQVAGQEELYRGITIGIVVIGLLLIVGLTCYVVRENRKEQRLRAERKRRVEEAVVRDVPPTYSQIVLRRDPPEYQESVMQEINPECNLNWSSDVVKTDSGVHPEVRATVAAMVRSQGYDDPPCYAMSTERERRLRLQSGSVLGDFDIAESRPTFVLGAP